MMEEKWKMEKHTSAPTAHTHPRCCVPTLDTPDRPFLKGLTVFCSKEKSDRLGHEVIGDMTGKWRPEQSIMGVHRGSLMGETFKENFICGVNG